MDFNIEDSWKENLNSEFQKGYFQSLINFLKTEEEAGATIYPENQDLFNAFTYAPLNKVKVVIIGQDPYHGPGQAHGLCFSVKDGVKIPPSLRNIYKELKLDLGIDTPVSGDLTHWAKQGVLLLNATLTVRANEAGSHQKKGWEQFTDAVIKTINKQCEGVVFFLWGAYAQKKGLLINEDKHYVLKSVHPSPLSASRGFFGNKHFSLANNYLIESNRQPIQW